jgi:hypothetical protein
MSKEIKSLKKTRLSKKGFSYADIKYFCEDIEDVEKFGSLTIKFVVLKGDVLELIYKVKIKRRVEG